MPKQPIKDSTEASGQKKLEKALKQAAHQWETTFDAISDAICLIEQTGRILRVNKAMSRFLDKPFKSIIGHYCFELIHGTMERIEECPIFRMQKSRKRESMLLQIGGRWFNITVDPIMDETGEIVCAVHIMSDITEVKKITDDLRVSEEKFRMIAENSIDDIWQLDIEGNVTYVSPSKERLFGYSEEEALNMNFMDFIVESDIPLAKETFNTVIEKKEPQLVQLDAIRKDGSTFSLEITVCPVMRDNILMGIQGIGRDITERKMARAEIEKRNTFIETIIDHLPIGLGVNKITDSSVLYINPKFEEIYGWPKEAIPDIDTFFQKAYPDPEYRRELQERIMADVISGDPERMQWSDIIATGMDGKQRIVSAKNIPLFDQDVMISTVQDISETKRLESQLRQSQKMESIGTLAGGIAHNFNNILSIIMGNTELAIDDIPDWSPVHEYLVESRNACLKAKDLIRQLLSFSRQSDEKHQPMDICPIVKESLVLLRSSISTNVSFKQHISPECDMVMADPTQIHQIMINLFTNSAHAMEESGGEIEVCIENICIAEEQPSLICYLKPGPYVKLSVKDTGCGIDPKDIERIFDPYFTTKEIGKGTGMGLALVHGIVKSHGGSILLDSRPGQGTTTSIFFPAIPRKAIESGEHGESRLPGGNECIFFIDDEVALVKLCQRWLERLGYEVAVESDPLKALSLIRDEPRRFDLIVTDMAMPHMTGDKLSEQILAIRPDMPIILCTGFSDRIDGEKAEKIGIQAFLMKPIGIKQLAETVRTLLDKKNSD